MIRSAQPADYKRIGALTVTAFVSDGFVDTEDVNAGAGYVQELADTERRVSQAQVWVAVEADEVIGVVTYCPLGSSYREVARDDEGEFRALAVDPQRRGLGAGLKLIEHCLRASRDDGFGGVAISSMDRMLAAHRLYYRSGFQRDPVRDWSPVPQVDLWAFALRF